jgi:spore coat polysaccharide biosynthesis protein SpsF
MRTIAIIQARMGSSRLPGKALMDLGGKTALARVVRRLHRSVLIDEVVVATTTLAPDDAIHAECERLQVRCLHGSEDDVLDRYCEAARASAADVVVRITADCPLIDAELVDETIRLFWSQGADYASNTLVLSYPRGLDVEAFTVGALHRAWHEAHQPYEREHVTPYFYEHPEWFRLASLEGEADYSRYRWTLDTVEDLQLIRAIYSRFENRDDFGWRVVLQFMQAEPEVALLNAHVVQKELHAS